MKFILVPIILLLSSCAKEIIISEDEIRLDVFYAENDHRPFTGICRICYPGTEIIKEEFRYKKGRLNGEFLSYYKNGEIKRKGTYSEGMLSGTLLSWDEQGNLILEANFVNDTLEGHYMTRYSNGDIKESGNYSENKRTGDWIEN